MEVNGKVALVTGAGSGIGRATALALAEAGARVVLADVDEAGGCKTLRAIDAAGGTAAFLKIDVTREEDVDRMVAYAEEAFGALHVLHNNAGINMGWPSFPDAARGAWRRTVAVNLCAVIAGIEAAVPLIKRSGGGVIINSASLAGLVAYEADPVYAATKHGVVGLTRSLASLKEEANIRVNCICPGFVDTPLPRRRLADMPAAERAGWEAALARLPMIAPADVADVVLEIIRDDGMAGQAVSVTHGEPYRVVPAPLAVG